MYVPASHISLEKYTSMTSADCRVISSSHVQFDEMKVRLWRSYVRIDPFHITWWPWKPVQLDGHLDWLHFDTSGFLNNYTCTCIRNWHDFFKLRVSKCNQSKWPSKCIGFYGHNVMWNSSIQVSNGCKSAFEVAPLLEGSKPTAHRSRDVAGRKVGIHAHEWKQQEAQLPNCRSEKSRQASPSLWTDKAKPPCACRLPRRRTTTRSPAVRLISKLSKATLTSRTDKIRRQNIRLNSCSFKGRTATIWSGKKVRRNNESHFLMMPGCWRFAKFAIGVYRKEIHPGNSHFNISVQV